MESNIEFIYFNDIYIKFIHLILNKSKILFSGNNNAILACGVYFKQLCYYDSEIRHFYKLYISICDSCISYIVLQTILHQSVCIDY